MKDISNILNAIRTESNKAYPDHSLDETLGQEAIAQIEGIAKAIKLFSEEEESEEVVEGDGHNIYSEFQPTCTTTETENSNKEKEKKRKIKSKQLSIMLADHILSDIRWYKKKRDKKIEEAKEGKSRQSSYLDLHLALQIIEARLGMVADFILIDDER